MDVNSTNINAAGPSGNVPKNYPFLNEWSKNIDSFGQQHPELINTPLFKETKAIIDGWKKDAQDGKELFQEGGQSPEGNAHKALLDALSPLISSTKLDMFAWSGFGDLDLLDEFTENVVNLNFLYNINRDNDGSHPTTMDSLIMKYNDAVNKHKLPTGHDALLNALHKALLRCGSNGLPQYIEWVKSSFHLPPGDQAWLAQFDVRG